MKKLLLKIGRCAVGVVLMLPFVFIVVSSIVNAIVKSGVLGWLQEVASYMLAFVVIILIIILFLSGLGILKQ